MFKKNNIVSDLESHEKISKKKHFRNKAAIEGKEVFICQWAVL